MFSDAIIEPPQKTFAHKGCKMIVQIFFFILLQILPYQQDFFGIGATIRIGRDMLCLPYDLKLHDWKLQECKLPILNGWILSSGGVSTVRVGYHRGFQLLVLVWCSQYNGILWWSSKKTAKVPAAVSSEHLLSVRGEEQTFGREKRGRAATRQTQGVGGGSLFSCVVHVMDHTSYNQWILRCLNVVS